MTPTRPPTALRYTRTRGVGPETRTKSKKSSLQKVMHSARRIRWLRSPIQAGLQMAWRGYTRPAVFFSLISTRQPRTPNEWVRTLQAITVSSSLRSLTNKGRVRIMAAAKAQKRIASYLAERELLGGHEKEKVLLCLAVMSRMAGRNLATSAVDLQGGLLRPSIGQLAPSPLAPSRANIARQYPDSSPNKAGACWTATDGSVYQTLQLGAELFCGSLHSLLPFASSAAFLVGPTVASPGSVRHEAADMRNLKGGPPQTSKGIKRPMTRHGCPGARSAVVDWRVQWCTHHLSADGATPGPPKSSIGISRG
ncbi:hypothetical protein QBC40DRAFT_351810 [Triangularia verruculosa]|uniref:Uncharacterized protein n=1 Tax=Triangularia verruculosa TaxID=2587418 RepID=A0AAN6XAE9_9PEZI|nr:hypothetical protein QBC40DRAFT_351810 [Triangularia verruculosa]